MQRESSSSVRIFWPKFDREALIRKLKEGVKELERRLPLRRVVLFGSYSRDSYTVASDVDLLVVYKGHHREDGFSIVKRVLDIPLLEPHLYSEEEYEGLKGRIDRMTAEGVVLFSADPLPEAGLDTRRI
ncbi:MAG: hypothetical protein DRQ02_08475 [Candidatus Latescibacterota bacterium]|nr:MAG: hypothetical protein DRQ02_08475 [Candidatus Latescibacterota bacterium]RKY68355.1 MAG: hypothetical protein DRQ24_11830 [Candidatus Latescibacterota bacterium]